MSNAKLKFIFGSMGSAKSLRLLTTAYNMEERGIQIMVLKPMADTRDGKDVIRSRVGIERECVSVDEDANLFELVEEYGAVLEKMGLKLKCVMIDECQFLEERQIDELSDVVDKLGITVLCYGLRTDFRSKLFPASKRLFEIADDFEEIETSCECGDNKTMINARFGENGVMEEDGEQILVGGDELYKPICRKCWKESKTRK